MGMMRSWHAIGYVALGVMLLAARLEAQTRLYRPSVDLGFGRGHGFGVPWVSADERGMVALRALVASPIRQLPKGTLLVALEGAVTDAFGDVDCIAIPGVRCGFYPGSASVAALIGWSTRADRAADARVMVGPAHIGTNEAHGLGFSSRADVGASVSTHVALTAWTSWQLLPRALEGRAQTLSAGLGLRLR